MTAQSIATAIGQGRVQHAQFAKAESELEPPDPDFLPPPGEPQQRPRQVAPRSIAEALGATGAEPVPAADVVEIDFSSALAMAAGQNPRVAFADARLREAFARWHAAKKLWLPSLRAGISYNKHAGTLQGSNGAIIDISRSSLHSGLGISAVGAGSPAVHGVFARFHTSDAVFQPKIAGFAAEAEDATATAVTNDLLLETALAYLTLLQTTQQEAIAKETQGNAEKLANLTKSFAESGQGPQSDADRAQTELAIRRNEMSRAAEAKRVAMARLAELVRTDPSLQLIPNEPTIVPIELVTEGTALSELIATGLANRPELAASQSLVCEAVSRLQREQYSTLLPSAILGVSTGRFGGGASGQPDVFRSRFDLDLGVYWEMRNLGFGDRAARAQAFARVDQAEAQQVAVMDRVAREITEAHAQVAARRGQIATAEAAVKAATDSYTRNLARIREGQGLPIEVLQSIQALDQARREYLRTLADFNEAQFRLHRALGWPIQ